ncbi:MAG: hypothetical protein KC486_12720, partial [Myxococcales bacterium]|nr:hypothetical protein [Myxococcales bacterium]
MRSRFTRLAAPLVVTLFACQGRGAVEGEKSGADAGAPAVRAGPASGALRYAAPACPQRYAFTMSIGSPAAAAAGLQLRGELLLETIDERRLALRVDKLDGALGLPPALSDTLGARFVLEIADDRRSLAAVERPTPFWDAFGTFGGLQVFWPTLPESTDPGASATWTLALPKSSGPAAPSPAGPRLVPQAAVQPPGDP